MPFLWKAPKLFDTVLVPLQLCGKGSKGDLGKIQSDLWPRCLIWKTLYVCSIGKLKCELHVSNVLILLPLWTRSQSLIENRVAEGSEVVLLIHRSEAWIKHGSGERAYLIFTWRREGCLLWWNLLSRKQESYCESEWTEGMSRDREESWAKQKCATYSQSGCWKDCPVFSTPPQNIPDAGPEG